MQDKIDFSKVDWQHILPRLGVDPKMIVNPKRRGPCPIEQTGSTRFRFDNREGRGTWICNCGSGDGVRLVALIHGTDDASAVRMIRDVVVGQPALRQAPTKVISPEKTPQQIEKARKDLQRVWSGSKPVAGTPAWVYLSKRVRSLDPAWLAKGLRFHPSLSHVDDENGSRSNRPALVSQVVDASTRDRIVTIHRTYLTSNGEKAPVSASQVKKVMTTTVDKLTGESIQMNNAKSALVIVAEGIESALAWVAATKNRYSVYAALNCYNLGQFRWPKGTKGLLVAGDNDPPNAKTGLRPGLHYATILRDRAQEAGLRVKMVLPPVVGTDFDDLWNAGDEPVFNLCKDSAINDLQQKVTA